MRDDEHVDDAGPESNRRGQKKGSGADPSAEPGAQRANGHDEAADGGADWTRWCREILTAEAPPEPADRAFVIDQLVRLIAGDGLLDFGEQLRLRELHKQVNAAAAKAAALRLDIWDVGEDTGPIPPREWLLGTVACRQFLSVLFGAGGVGKTSLMLLYALSMASGVTLTPERVYGRFRVLLLSFEDGKDELRRRVRAAMMHHKIKRETVAGHLFIAAIQQPELKLATIDTDTRAAVRGALVAQLEREIARFKPDIVFLEPFVKIHAVPENDNNAMDFVASVLVEFAIKYNIATFVGHHVRKGGDRPGDADAGRGGGALKDAGRLVNTAVPMSDQEATTFGIAPEEARQLFRVDAAKVNLAALAKEKWYRTVGVELGNGAGRYLAGDNIGVVEEWKPPAVMAGVTAEIANKILDEIDAAPEDARLSAHKNAKGRSARPILLRHVPDCDDNRAQAILGVWLKSGLVLERKYHDAEQRKDLTGLFVDAEKRPRTMADILSGDEPD